MNAAEAWGCVIREIRNCGWPREKEALSNLAEKDIRISELVRNMGWQRLCMASMSMLNHERSFFVDQWEKERAA